MNFYIADSSGIVWYLYNNNNLVALGEAKYPPRFYESTNCSGLAYTDVLPARITFFVPGATVSGNPQYFKDDVQLTAVAIQSKYDSGSATCVGTGFSQSLPAVSDGVEVARPTSFAYKLPFHPELL